MIDHEYCGEFRERIAALEVVSKRLERDVAGIFNRVDELPKKIFFSVLTALSFPIIIGFCFMLFDSTKENQKASIVEIRELIEEKYKEEFGHDKQMH